MRSYRLQFKMLLRKWFCVLTGGHEWQTYYTPTGHKDVCCICGKLAHPTKRLK